MGPRIIWLGTAATIARMTSPKRPLVVLVAAVARDGAIGRANDLLWRHKLDQQHFRQLTMGHPVVMGRKTWDSLPERFRPLPGRRNIVVTRNAHWQAEGAERAGSLDAALALAAGAERISIIGGAQVYAAALPQADELALTEIDAVFPDADTHFPAWERAAFTEAGPREHHADDAGPAFDFVTYRRR
jgi:dihydrofolate reductase